MNDLSSKRQHLIRKLMMEAADDDYICARICAQNSLPQHFAWNAGQAIEKYVKCIVVLNGESVKGHSHDFFKLFSNEVHSHYRDFFPESIDLHGTVKIKECFQDYASEPLLDCTERFKKMSNPSVRYRTLDTLVQPYDLQKLDRLTFLLRRLCFPFPDGSSEREEHIRQLKTDHTYSKAANWPTVEFETPAQKSKLSYLHFENTAHFPDTYPESKGWYNFSWNASPKTSLEATGRLDRQDSEWLKNTIKL